MIENYLKLNKLDYILTAPYLEIYIPISYFEKNLAKTIGDELNTFGLLNTQLFNDKEKPIGKIEMLNLPTSIILYPSDVEDKNMTLPGDNEPSRYRICKFYRNDRVMKAFLQSDIDNSIGFLKLLLGGKIDNVPYNKILNLWEKNLELNDSPNESPVILGLIISEIYRDKKNPLDKFIKTLDKNPKTSQLDYITANAREICARNSVFAALTFQDIDSMITTSLNMSIQNKKQKISPIEKIIKM